MCCVCVVTVQTAAERSAKKKKAKAERERVKKRMEEQRRSHQVRFLAGGGNLSRVTLLRYMFNRKQVLVFYESRTLFSHYST